MPVSIDTAVTQVILQITYKEKWQADLKKSACQSLTVKLMRCYLVDKNE